MCYPVFLLILFSGVASNVIGERLVEIQKSMATQFQFKSWPHLVSKYNLSLHDSRSLGMDE